MPCIRGRSQTMVDHSFYCRPLCVSDLEYADNVVLLSEDAACLNQIMKKRTSEVNNARNKKSSQLSRERLMKNQLRHLGKVGGIKDSRFGANSKNKSNHEKYLQRHVVERLRHLDEVQLEKDENDPLVKAAFGGHSKEKFKSLRMDEQSDVGIHASVAEEFFSKDEHSVNFRDMLAEKISVSKLAKLKRVEENEEQRDRLKEADSDWSQKIRFLLSGVSFKSKKSTSAEVKANRTNFIRLLETIGSDKRVAPVGAPTPPDRDLRMKQLARLQSMLNTASVGSSVKKDRENHVIEHSDRRKNVSYLLRTLIGMPEFTSTVLVFLTNQLITVRPSSLKEAIQLLWLTQLVLESCEERFTKEHNATLISHTMGSSAFCPELIQVLTSLVCLAHPGSPVHPGLDTLVQPQNSLQPDNSTFARLDIRMTDPSVKFTREQLPMIRLSWCNRLISLCRRTHTLYSRLLPPTVCTFLFAPMRDALEQLNHRGLPTELSQCTNSLLSDMDTNARTSTPDFLVSNIRLTLLNSTKTEESKAMKNTGLIPQLEPRFDDRLDARRTKNGNNRSLTQRKLTRERRGAMREVRRDSQFLAAHQLKLTKQNDEERNRKTQAIIGSMRAIED